MPWVKLVIEDFQILREAIPDKLSSTPDPYRDLEFFWTLASNFPNEWKELTRKYYSEHEDPRNIPKPKPKSKNDRRTEGNCGSSSVANQRFACEACGESFSDWRKLSTHRWAKHRIKHEVRQFVPEISTCPICHVNLNSCVRLLKHLSERRIGSKFRKDTC